MIFVSQDWYGWEGDIKSAIHMVGTRAWTQRPSVISHSEDGVGTEISRVRLLNHCRHSHCVTDGGKALVELDWGHL